MSPLEVERMGASRFLKYEAAMKILEAREMLSAMSISDYPHMKKESRQKLHREVYKRANPNLFDAPKKALTLADVARVLANGRR